MLHIPSYIEAAGVRGSKIEFQASLSTIDIMYETSVPLVDRALDQAPQRARLAFAAAVSEWIAWRLDGVSDVTDLLHFAEAMWVANVDYRYAKEISHDPPANTRGGEYVAYRTWEKLNALFLLCPKGKGKSRACVQLTLLARFVLPKSKHAALQGWIKFAIGERVSKFWQLKSSSDESKREQGSPLPREAFDPAVKFVPAKANDYLREFLASVDPGANPYLRKPAELKKLGISKPYTI
jgi:hypothetical protein